MEKPIDLNDAQSVALALVKTPSITGSAGEVSYPETFLRVLAQIPYFRKNPELLLSIPIPGDMRQRANVFALAKGKGTRCVVLTGHYDVVDTSDYGVFEPFAFDPQALEEKMIAHFARKEHLTASEQLLLKDLQSGEFMLGRGLLDMKSGLAAGIVVLSRFLQNPDRTGNILFLAVPDEEGSSAGMKAASTQISEFALHHGIEIECVINLDAAVDSKDGEEGKAVFCGSVSKLLPFIVFVGRAAHAGAPFEGFNPSLAAAFFVRDMEGNSELLNSRSVVPGEEPPPPTVLYLREMRSRYDVTMPADVFCAMNVLSHEKSPEKAFAKITEAVERSLEGALSLFKERASAFSRLTQSKMMAPNYMPRVIDFALVQEKAERVAPGITQRLRENARRLHPEDRVLQTAYIVHEMLPYATLETPCAVVGFAPPFYALSSVDAEQHRDFLTLLKETVMRFNKEQNESIRLRPYFPGISDMSFIAPEIASNSLSFLRELSPVDQDDLVVYSKPKLDVPVINIGPWGREYHRPGERVHRKYAFSLLPELLFRVTTSVLSI